MRDSTLVIAACLLLGACGGSVTGGGERPDGGTAGTGGAPATGGKPATGGQAATGGVPGAGGCPPIPAVPEYDCKGRPPEPGDCGPSGSPDAGIGYPQGCAVKLTTPDSFSGGCGPQVCNCSLFPNSDGTMRSTWVCPL